MDIVKTENIGGDIIPFINESNRLLSADKALSFVTSSEYKTLTHKKATIKILNSYIKEFGTGPFTPESILAFFKQQSKYIPSTFNHRKSCFKTALTNHPSIAGDTKTLFAIEQIFKQIDTPKTSPGVGSHQMFSDEEVHDLLEAANSNKRTKKLGIIIEALLQTGCRISGLIEIQKEYINIHPNGVSISILEKGEKAREVYITHELHKKITDNFNHPTLLFSNEQGKPLNRHNIYQALNRLAKRALKRGHERKISPHMFRHTCYRILREKGMSLKAASEYLGHASVTTTLTHYDHDKPNIEDVLESFKVL